MESHIHEPVDEAAAGDGPDDEGRAASAGRVNASAADVYAEFFVPALFAQWTDTVLAAAEVAPGDRVLDVGCGTGVVAVAAREVVGERGSVHAIDPNEAMLAVARRLPTEVEWHRGSAELLPFGDDEFDRVLCQFALMFFDDRSGALAELARVTRPRGRVTVATWAQVEESPGYARMVQLLRSLFGDRAADALLAPFSIGTVEQLRSLLRESFVEVEVVRRDGVARFESIDAWVHTDIRGWTLADMIDDEQFAELLDAARVELAEFVGPDGTASFPAPALIATARPRPGQASAPN